MRFRMFAFAASAPLGSTTILREWTHWIKREPTPLRERARRSSQKSKGRFPTWWGSPWNKRVVCSGNLELSRPALTDLRHLALGSGGLGARLTLQDEIKE